MSVKNNAKYYARLRDEQASLFELYARRNGLTGKSLLVFLWLYYNPQGLSQEYIAKKTFSTKQVIRAIVRNLEEANYVNLKPDAQDRRRKIVSLTSAGLSYSSSLLLPLERYEEEAMAALTSQQQESLLAATEIFSNKLRQAIENHQGEEDAI
ncbi:MarR family winged helix-turn-helix transcriptional regulator [Streptococcus dentiloxodontae]